MRLILLQLWLLTLWRQNRAGPLQERVPLFRLTQQDPSESSGSNSTDSPCEGLPAAGSTTLILTNRSLERLPGCLARTLRSLDGSHNLLRALSVSELGRLTELQVLTLRHNRIATLRWGRRMPAGLHTLDLSYNLLAALPPCAGPALRSLRALVLAGNPLQVLQPRAFACFPALQLLNLSSSALGHSAQGGISEQAFTGAGGEPLATLEVLDLSGTYLERVESRWIRDLPKLMSLFLRKMPRLRVLEGDIFKMTPNLRQLDCQDSSALTSVPTHIFQDTPHLQILLLQNCNLSSFLPWTVNSSQVLTVNLFGNPLTCSCELSWLLMDANRTVLSRAEDTVCIPVVGSGVPFSAPLSLSQLPGVCKSNQNTSLPVSTPPHVDSLAYAPLTQGLSTGQDTVYSILPVEGQQSVTKVPSHTVAPLTQAAWMYNDVGEGTALSTTNSTADYDSLPLRTSPTAGAQHGEQTVRLVLEPGISPASTPPASKRLGPFPPSQNPMNTSQPHQRTQITTQAPKPSPTEDGIPILLLDDSEEEEGTTEKVGAPPQNVLCDYHPCKHLQIPCAELQRRSRCLCPGLSREDTIPDPPKLQGVLEMTDTSALIHWCAPNSVVLRYQILYSAEGGVGNQSVVGDIYATARQHPLYGLSPGTTYRVCVLAANRAGLSPLRASDWRRPCVTFTTKPSSVVIFTVLSAASGLLLVSTLVLSVFLCRQCPMPYRQNYDMHLVDFKNHVFLSY
uniref:Leucine-rich repeat neuronal protein 4 n=1 Tax=Castor canadensis TaxID=51338 RepID=A0A8B7UT89_CASCN|nr:leucine-rich repeat neuronal protein 4 [Castor canadensis]